MQPTITARDRTSLLAAALSKVEDANLRGAVDHLGTQPGIPRAVLNAANALRRSRRVGATVVRPPYRTVLPYLATVVADECLARTIEVLGDHSDDPSREQLLEAVDTVRESFSDAIVGVMLASVAANAMPASDLCFEIATTDARFGLADGPSAPDGADGHGDANEPETAAVAHLEDLHDEDGDRHALNSRRATAEQRAARRERRKSAAEDRRRRHETAERAAALVRSARKQERGGLSAEQSTPAAPEKRSVPALVRQPSLTPAQREEFDPAHALVGAVVYAWVPFDRNTDDDESPEGGNGAVAESDEDGPGDTSDMSDPDGPNSPNGPGKLRPCVVIGVGPTHLLVRPGYSKGGGKSRDWTSVPLRLWQEAGLDQPTWIGVETVRVPRPEVTASLRRLSVTDWNALW
ncbi:MAG: hypothetical protein WBG41_15560 [Acidimicrobiales bacterium]